MPYNQKGRSIIEPRPIGCHAIGKRYWSLSAAKRFPRQELDPSDVLRGMKVVCDWVLRACQSYAVRATMNPCDLHPAVLLVKGY